MEQTTNISATRMERLRQAERLKTTKRAHQLLEDKYDEMVHKFTVLIKNNRSLRELVENKLNQILQLFIASSTRMTSKAIDTALDACRSEITLTCSSQNIMGLSIPHVEIESVSTPSNSILLTTPTNFDEAITLLRQLNATIIELANIEKTCDMLADEIEKVRRRINSLKYNVIPNINSKIKFITMKLDENQRETQVRVMKIKDMQSKPHQ